MAHELEIINGEASFAYNQHNGNPWHRLGVPMDGTQTLDDMLTASRGDYEVTKEPVYVLTADGFVEASGYAATVRPNPNYVAPDPTDLDAALYGTDEPEVQVLGVVANTYEILQNGVAVSKALDIVGASDGEAVIDTMGVLFDGKRFFACIDLGTLVVDPDGINDRITRYLGVYTSHDGSQALTYALSDLRWVCNNTVTAGINTAHRVFRARHTSSMDARMAEAHQVLGISAAWAKDFGKMAEELLRVEGGSNVLDTTIKAVWPKGEGDDWSATKDKNWSARRDTIHELYRSDTCAKGFGHSGWTVYNAVVEYVDHRNPRITGNRAALAAISDSSGAAQAKAKAYDTLLVGA